MIRRYYILTKPGIIYGNAITAAGGFFLAAQHHFPFGLFVAMLVGISLVMASACVFNNYLDRDIDALMKRTKNRALVKQEISPRNALVYAATLGMVGFLTLALFTNLLTAYLSFIGFVFYVIVYGISKRRTVYGTIIGSISGAVPPVVGYCAVTNHFDLGALLIFLILVVWQMPHFYAIAMFRIEDYAAAAIPVLPIKKGMHVTKVQILIYIVGFIVATSLLTLFGFTGYLYLTVTALLGLVWLWQGLASFKTDSDKVWGRKVFRFSLVVLTSLCVIIPVDALLRAK